MVAADDGGTIQVTNTNVTTFAGDIGADANLLLLNLDRSATFNGVVNAKGLDLSSIDGNYCQKRCYYRCYLKQL